MTVIHKTIDVPQSRRVNLEFQLPEELPSGKAEIFLTIASLDEAEHNPDITPAREFPCGVKRFQGLAGALSHSQAFAGDPLEMVRAMRDEW